MNVGELLMSLTIICLMMALAALLELAAPMFVRARAQRSRGAANLGLTVLTLALNWVLASAAAAIALALSWHAPGLMARRGVPFAAQVVVSVVVLDFFFGYLAHRAMHVSPSLWRMHRVHHADPFVDVTTTFRTHPVEGLWRFVFMIVPVWIFALPAEAVVVYRLLSAINGILEHANIRVWQPLDRAVSLVWVTPNMHKVHHSRDCGETDSNYGNILSIYDRILGSFTPTARAASVVYGIDDVDPVRAQSLPHLLAMPFQALKAGAPVCSQTAAVQKISA
jgi:sterol desaturase/sphingolipid hydroxylase (fatty acid hydroxylase superfamily)